MVPHLGPSAVTIPATYGNQHVGRGTSPVNILCWNLFMESCGCALEMQQSGVAELMLPFRPGAAPQAAGITATLSLSFPVGIG